jgi:hypothetical protein
MIGLMEILDSEIPCFRKPLVCMEFICGNDTVLDLVTVLKDQLSSESRNKDPKCCDEDGSVILQKLFSLFPKEFHFGRE